MSISPSNQMNPTWWWRGIHGLQLQTFQLPFLQNTPKLLVQKDSAYGRIHWHLQRSNFLMIRSVLLRWISFFHDTTNNSQAVCISDVGYTYVNTVSFSWAINFNNYVICICIIIYKIYNIILLFYALHRARVKANKIKNKHVKVTTTRSSFTWFQIGKYNLIEMLEKWCFK